MDIQHFEIMVNAMLTWSDEAKAPKKEARHGGAMRDDVDDVDEFVDNDDDFEDDEAPVVKRSAAWPATGEPEPDPDPEPELPEAEPAE